MRAQEALAMHGSLIGRSSQARLRLPSDFFETTFQRAPLLVRSALEEAESIVDIADLEHALIAGAHTDHVRIRATKTTGGKDRKQRLIREEKNASSFARALRQGFTIVYDNPDILLRPVSELCSELVRLASSGHCRNVRCGVYAAIFLSPANAQGISLHFDSKDVFAVQLQGEKTWLLYPPPVPCPLDNSGDNEYDDLLATEPLLRATLRPGDLLYVPRGFLHAVSTGAEPSLHVTLGLTAITWLDVLKPMMENQSVFREAVPSAFLDADGDRESLAASLSERLMLLADPSHFLKEGTLQRLADTVADPKQTKSLLSDSLSPPLAPVGCGSYEKRFGTRYVVTKTNEGLVIGFPGGRVKVAASNAKALATILERDAFTFSDLSNACSEGAPQELLHALELAGFVYERR